MQEIIGFLRSIGIDSFSVVHVATFFVACAVLFSRLRDMLVFTLILGLFWEVIEGYTWIFGDFGKGEDFINRWITDPIFDLIGAWLAWQVNYKKKK